MPTRLYNDYSILRFVRNSASEFEIAAAVSSWTLFFQVLIPLQNYIHVGLFVLVAIPCLISLGGGTLTEVISLSKKVSRLPSKCFFLMGRFYCVERGVSEGRY